MPRLLVVSNNALSGSNSNGRTMMNMLKCFSQEELAQFCLQGVPDDGVCAKFYRVSDQDALYALKHFGKKKPAEAVRTEAKPSSNKTKQPAVVKNSAKPVRNHKNMVLRDVVWRSYLWWNRDFNQFLSDFQPEVVLLQAGDCPFMYYIGMKIAGKFKIPLVMYNSEGYVLKDVLYASSSKSDKWHNILQRRLQIAYTRIMSKADFCIYLTEYLEKCYQEKYPHPGKSIAIYTSSEMHPLEDRSGSPFKLAYCGNLGVGRIAPLCDIAEILQKVDSIATLNIYGSFNSQQEQMLLCSHPNVRYHGRVPYEEISRIMSKANLLVHCENVSRLKNLIHAFSTKIADSLACGRPFLVYADERYPFVEYLREHNAAHIATNKEELETLLGECINNKNFLDSHLYDALILAENNHSQVNNSKRFFNIIISLCHVR